MESVIKVSKLTKIFNKSKVAVNKVSFEVEKNTIFGLLGPNGCGKTTTLRMLTTLLKPTSGDIEIESIRYSTGDLSVLQDIGYVPQKDALYRALTVWENADLFFSAYRYSGNRKDQISSILEKVDLLQHKNVLANDLSGGMAKRLSIACAIVHRPKIIFFDEVTMGLDPIAREKIWRLITELKQDASVIMTTHYMDEAEALCDCLMIMRNGKIIANDSPANIIKQFHVKNLHEAMISMKEDTNV